jgi:hypothetical protein
VAFWIVIGMYGDLMIYDAEIAYDLDRGGTESNALNPLQFCRSICIRVRQRPKATKSYLQRRKGGLRLHALSLHLVHMHGFSIQRGEYASWY